MYLMTEAKKKRDERVTPLNVFYPSSAGQCIRKLWNEKKVPVEFPPETYKRFLMGNLAHDWLQKYILPEAESEVSLKWTDGDIAFSGRIDAKLPDRLVEFKTIAALNYVKGKPKPEHFAQLNMYMHATGIHHGTIVYVTKNEVDVIEHDVEYSPKIYKQTVKDFRKVYKALVDNVEPKTSKCPTPWSCTYCKEDNDKKRIIIKAVMAKRKRLKEAGS